MSTTEVETYVVRGDRVMADQILWQRYKRATPLLLEKMLDLNPGLGGYGPYIPHGTVIKLPVDRPRAYKMLNLVRLTD